MASNYRSPAAIRSPGTHSHIIYLIVLTVNLECLIVSIVIELIEHLETEAALQRCS